MVRVKYIGDYYKVVLDNNKVYDAEVIDDAWYRIYIDAYEDYFMFEKNQFVLE